MVRIVIDGNVASGKTHYLHLLEEQGYHVSIPETPEGVRLFKKYQSEPTRYALAYYLNLLTQYQQPGAPGASGDLHLYEGSPYTLQHVYGELWREQPDADRDEHRVFLQYLSQMGWVPDIIIYLTCHPNVCHERSKLREVDPPSLDLVRYIHLKYEIAYDEAVCPVKLYKVNSQDTPAEVLSCLVEIIKNNTPVTRKPSKSF
jgi:deoxyadenosine/deoxycytidine kinase